MKRLLVITFASITPAFQLYAQGSSADFNPRSHHTSAIDAKGVRHDGNAYKGSPPWLLDRVGGPAPDYPVHERAMRHQGEAIVRLTLDLKSGRTVKVALVKSSGYSTLDRCAMTAFSRWTWRPGSWKEIELPVKFEMGNASAPPPSGMARLPRS